MSNYMFFYTICSDNINYQNKKTVRNFCEQYVELDAAVGNTADFLILCKDSVGKAPLEKTKQIFAYI